MTARCKAGKLLGSTHTMAQPDRALLRAWMDTGKDHAGRTVAAQTMAQALAAEGHDAGATTLKDHRGRRCVCFREDVTA